MKTGRRQFVRKHKGFTLIEIAIVLVIIGLLLGGVLQGQQLIENSRVKQAVNSFNGLAAATFSYQDRYGRLPGDDPGAKTRGEAWPTNAGPVASNGAIDAEVANTFKGGGETTYFFQNLRSAGFIAGDPNAVDAAALPQNPFGGLIGITTDVVNSSLNGIKVCMSNVSGTGAIALDTELDDGLIKTGRFRGTISSDLNTAPGGEAATTEYTEDGIYTVCYRM